VKWFTHVLWGAMVPLLFSVYDERVVFSAAFLHTAAVDILGHERRGPIVRRSWYHDMLSIFLAVPIAVALKDWTFLWLGVAHVLLDWLSPGRLGVSWAWSALWALIGVIIYIGLSNALHA